MPDLIGKTLGEFQIVEQIGKGGMATIYKAYQPSLDRDVAIKILPSYYLEQDETFLTRFKNEAKAIAKLRHPNILMVMSYGEFEGITYIAMEYVEAGTLKDRLKKPITFKETSLFISQMASALDYAHAEGIIHRDVKPSNILLPKPDWALLTDFGLARIVGGANLTQSGMTVGTPSYMSPEQGSGGKVDSRSDVYSLGVILYEMLVGELPYQAETPMAVVVKHIVDPLPMPRDKNPNLPEDFQRIILKSLAKDPGSRYQRAGELAEAVEKAIAINAEVKVDRVLLENAPTTKIIQDGIPKPEKVATAVSPEDTSSEAEKKQFTWTIIAAAVVVVVVGFFAISSALGGFPFSKKSQSQPTETVEVSPTNTEEPTPESTPLPTATEFVPSPTPLPTSDAPTPWTAPEPSGEIIQGESGDILFEDDFSDPNSGWDRYHDKDVFSEYVDGKYQIGLLRGEDPWWGNPYLGFGDVRVEVDTELFDGSEDNLFGIICSYESEDYFFMALISSDGYYGFEQVEGYYYDLLGEGLNETDAINLGGASNHLRVDCIGDTMSLYVNGVFVDSLSGLALVPGDVGLWVETFDAGNPVIEFDNFVVIQP